MHASIALRVAKRHILICSERQEHTNIWKEQVKYIGWRIPSKRYRMLDSVSSVKHDLEMFVCWWRLENAEHLQIYRRQRHELTFLLADDTLCAVIGAVHGPPFAVFWIKDDAQRSGVTRLHGSPVPVGVVGATSPARQQLQTNPELKFEVVSGRQSVDYNIIPLCQCVNIVVERLRAHFWVYS